MKKFLRILVVIIGNLITLPIQLIVIAIYWLTNLTAEQKDSVDDFCNEAWEQGIKWIKTGDVCDEEE
jgi:hypothetical protein